MCASSEPAEKLEQVTLQLKWLHQFQFAGYYAAKEHGFYREEGLDVTIRRRDPGKNNIRQVLDGEAEYGIADSILLLYRMQGEPVVLLAPIFQQSPLIYMSLRGSGIESPYQFKGKRVMVYPRGTDGLPLEAMFNELGLKEETFWPVLNPAGPDALIKGEIDVYPGYLTNEPYYFRQKNINVNIIDPQNYGVDFYGDMLFTSQAELENHPGRAERFLRASLKGWEYALDNTEEIIDFILQKYGTDKSREHLQYEADIVRRIINPDHIPLGKLDEGRLRYLAKTFKRLGFTESDEVPHDFFLRQPLEPLIELTDKEMQWLKKRRGIRVANENDWPPFDFAENGIARGFSIDLLKLIAQKTGLRLEYVNGYPWDELLEKGRRKEVDVFPAIWKSEEREQFLNFSTPYIDTPHLLVIHKDERHITTIDDLKDRILAGVKGFASTELVRKYYPDVQLREVGSAAEGLRLVSYGRADAYLGSYGETDFEMRRHLITNLKIAGETTLGGRIQASQLHIAVRKDWPELSEIVRKALNSISQEEMRVLQRKWLQAEIRQTTLELSSEERIWLKEHPVLQVAFDPDWPPVEFADGAGGISGIAADYLKRISELLGVRIEPASPSSWKEMLTSFRRGDFDFFSAISLTPQRNEWMEFTAPYLSVPIVIVTREEVPYIGTIEDLGDRTVAVVDGYASQDLLFGNYPDVSLLPALNVKEGLMAVTNGEAFAFVGSLATISHIIGREGLSELKVSGETPFTFDVGMGVRRGETILLNLLRKALAAIPSLERSAIYSKWIHVNFEPTVDYSLLWKVSASALIAVALVLYWNRRLSSMARELKIAGDAAEAANRAKSVFLANMSHELRTPLTSILGYAQLLEQASALTKTQREGVEVIQSNGMHLLTLINDVLDFARIETNRLELYPEEFALPDFLKQLVEIARSNAEQKGLSFTYNASDDLPAIVSGDQKRLRQILLNILRNAVKFTPQGSVIFSVTKVAQDDQRVTIRFDVEDSGIGISPEQLETIFQPFQQADPYRVQEGGKGLGLTISRHLAHMMGSQILVSSREGQGARFHFELSLPAIAIEKRASATDKHQSGSVEASEHLSQEMQILALESLPPNYLAALKRGAEETNIDILRSAINQIRERNDLLADALAQSVYNFKYDEILALIHKVNEH